MAIIFDTSIFVPLRRGTMYRLYYRRCYIRQWCSLTGAERYRL